MEDKKSNHGKKGRKEKKQEQKLQAEDNNKPLYYTGDSRLITFLNKYFDSKLYQQSLNHVRPRISGFVELEKHASEPWSLLDLTHFFFKTYGVNVFTEGVLHTFKYEVCVTSEWSPVVLECRGFIAQRESLVEPKVKEWTVASRPFDKFFNQAESECPIMTDGSFQKATKEAYFVEKLDGTCMQLWYCGVEEIKNNYQAFMNDLKLSEDAKLDQVEEIIEEQKRRITEDLESKKHSSETSSSTDPSNTSKSVWTEEEKRERTFWKTRDKSMKRQAAKDKGTASAALEMRHSTEQPDSKSNNFHGWRVSTLGMITPNSIFQKLFWNFFESSPQLFSHLDKNYTLLFELCCDENKVVTKYNKDRLLLIGARHKITGVNKTYAELQQLQQEQFVHFSVHVELPRIEKLLDLGIDSLPKAKKWVEDEAVQKNVVHNSASSSTSTTTVEMGDVPEGWCVWMNGVPIAKMKNSKYLDKHGIITGNPLYVRNIVIKRFWEGTLDDVYSVLSDGMKHFVEEIKQKVALLIQESERVVDHFRTVLKDKNFWEEDPKKRGSLFAKVVQEWTLTEKSSSWKGLLFVAKEQITKDKDDCGDIESITMKWLKEGNWKKFDEMWKNTQIQEITSAEQIQQKGKGD